MDTSAPTTPTVRRSFSLPVSRQPASPDSQIEILFNLPSARIVAFTTSNTSPSPDSRKDSLGDDVEPGTYPWTSRFERTIAVGALRLYRAPGSVAFLNCAHALKPILPKSQAWCVDGDSKFVLQIRPPQYWRIEVPNKTAEEGIKIEEFKRVLEEVLRFEKTPCPFQRNFTVELPKAPETPVKRKPWKPVERPKTVKASSSAEDLTRLSHRSLSHSPSWSSRLSKSRSPSPLSSLDEVPTTSDSVSQESYQQKDVQNRLTLTESPDIKSSKELAKIAEIPLLPPIHVETPLPKVETGESTGSRSESETFSEAIEDADTPPECYHPPSTPPFSDDLEKDDRPQALQRYSRSTTAPPVLSLVTSPPSGHRSRSISPVRTANSIAPDSAFSSSVESFHSTQSWHSPLDPPSPYASSPSSPTTTYPFPHQEIVLPKRPDHTRDTSEITVMPETPRCWGTIDTISETESTPHSTRAMPQTPTLSHAGSDDKSDEEQFEIFTPPTIKPLVRHRATTSSNSRRRALSPLPAAVNLFSPPKPPSSSSTTSRRMNKKTVRHLPRAIIQKTCEILMSPPSHLFQLMMNIASKIAAGEWRGFLAGYGYGEGEAVHWDFEEEYGDLAADTPASQRRHDDDAEDDYGMRIGKGYARAGGSWEVD